MAARESSGERRARVARIVAALGREYADAQCALQFETPFQLLVATILSAQCTDERVNLATRTLFARYPTAQAIAALTSNQLEALIRSTGFFRNKAKNILACSKQLVDEFGGEPPTDMEQLVNLPGVGRKTANVVLGTAFGLATGVVVDTHVTRLSLRLGLTRNSDAVRIEKDLMGLVERSEWINFSHRLIHHGRRICQARAPACDRCVLAEMCPKVGLARPKTRSARAG